MAKKSNTITIELYDGWQGENNITWRKGVILHYRGQGDVNHLGQALEEKLVQAKAQMIADGLLNYWYSQPVGGLLIALSQDRDSGYKRVPRLQPRLYRPKDTVYLFSVYLGPEQGAYAIEAYQLEPTPQSQGVIQQFKPLDWRHAAKQPQ